MKNILIIIAVLSSTFSAIADDEPCKINLWDENLTTTKIVKLIVEEKGYEAVFDDSADWSLNISTAGFAETGCNDGGFFGDKNFKRVNAYAEIRYKNQKVIDSIYGSDIQTESTTFNNPEHKRIACANSKAAYVSAAYKIPHCQTLKDLLKGK